MFFDDLPIWGFIGKVEKLMHAGEKPELRYYLFTHIHFDIHYNDDRVIEACLEGLMQSMCQSGFFCPALLVSCPHYMLYALVVLSRISNKVQPCSRF